MTTSPCFYTFLLSTLLGLACASPQQDASVADAGGKKADSPEESAGALGLMDVSILFPVQDEHVPHLLGTQNEVDGNTRVLLDEDVFNLAGTETFFLTETADRDKHYDKLRVTSLRLDPCIDGFDPHAAHCSKGIRVVLQPIWPNGDGFTVYDASVHSFFELSELEWAAFLEEYSIIRTRELRDEALGIHPVLAEDMEGEFSQNLRSLVTEYANSERMIRMTIMGTGRSGNNWFWAGFDRVGNAWTKMALLHGAESDSFTQFGRDHSILPQPLPNFPSELLHNDTLDNLSDQQVQEGMARLYEIENPLLSNSTNVRCVSCHIADETRLHVLERRGLAELDLEERYQVEELDLMATKADANIGKNMHAFSYFGQDNPTISQRVINESAEVVRVLNASAAQR